MLLQTAGNPLIASHVAQPNPEFGEIRVQVFACGVCRTDLHILDGELRNPKLPFVLGHEIVGRVDALGPEVESFEMAQRVGIPWLGSTCGACQDCRTERENLCAQAQFMGYHMDGGYAEYTVAHQRYCFPIDASYSDAEAAPLLCAGLIGYRALRKAGDPGRLGIYGFGAAAHIVVQIARHEGREVFAYTRPGDTSTQQFARDLGATWAGDSTTGAPELLDAAIIFAPVGELLPVALRATRKGGTVVCAGIHMSKIPAFSYDLLWGERLIQSVANLTHRDGEVFLDLAPKVPIRTEVQRYPLEAANKALEDLRRGRVRGVAVLMPTI